MYFKNNFAKLSCANIKCSKVVTEGYGMAACQSPELTELNYILTHTLRGGNLCKCNITIHHKGSLTYHFIAYSKYTSRARSFPSHPPEVWREGNERAREVYFEYAIILYSSFILYPSFICHH